MPATLATFMAEALPGIPLRIRPAACIRQRECILAPMPVGSTVGLSIMAGSVEATDGMGDSAISYLLADRSRKMVPHACGAILLPESDSARPAAKVSEVDTHPNSANCSRGKRPSSTLSATPRKRREDQGYRTVLTSPARVKPLIPFLLNSAASSELRTSPQRI